MLHCSWSYCLNFLANHVPKQRRNKKTHTSHYTFYCKQLVQPAYKENPKTDHIICTVPSNGMFVFLFHAASF